MSEKLTSEELLDKEYNDLTEDLKILFNQDGSYKEGGDKKFWIENMDQDEDEEPDWFHIIEHIAPCGGWRTDGDDPDRKADYIIQFAYGGPQIELRLHGRPVPYRVEFWVLPWYDSAFVDVTRDKRVQSFCELWLDMLAVD